MAVEQDDDSVDYRRITLKKKTAFILGNEVNGVDLKLLHLADVIAGIPLKGKKESLNVSVTAGIVLFSAR